MNKSLLKYPYLFLSFCASCLTLEPPLSPHQLRIVQSRSYDAISYKEVLLATKDILQDEGYIIRNQDFEGGLLLAERKNTLRDPQHNGFKCEEEQEDNSDGQKYIYKKGKFRKVKKTDRDIEKSIDKNRYKDREDCVFPEFNILETYIITANFENVSTDQTKVRLAIEKSIETNKGNKTGGTIKSASVFNDFYNKLTTEIEKRKIYRK